MYVSQNIQTLALELGVEIEYANPGIDSRKGLHVIDPDDCSLAEAVIDADKENLNLVIIHETKKNVIEFNQLNEEQSMMVALSNLKQTIGYLLVNSNYDNDLLEWTCRDLIKELSTRA